MLISGREAKATVQWRNKRLAEASTRQSKLVKGSSRWRRLQRRKKRMLDKARRRMNDLVHKSTRLVADAFPGATCYVGEPFNDAAAEMRPHQAQQVSQVAHRTATGQLDYKTSGAIQIDEAYSSQTCPRCGARNKCRRTYRCATCGIVAPRDVIGATNILCIGQHGALQIDQVTARDMHFLHPVKVSRGNPSSSGGHPAGSSA